MSIHHSCLSPYLILVSMKRGTDAHLIHNSVYCRYGCHRGTHFIWWRQGVQKQILGLYHGKYSCLARRSGAACLCKCTHIIIHSSYLSLTRNLKFTIFFFCIARAFQLSVSAVILVHIKHKKKTVNSLVLLRFPFSPLPDWFTKTNSHIFILVFILVSELVL